jgi:hypothetical protein
VILLDVVLGYGSHPDPRLDDGARDRSGAASAPASARSRSSASVCGTDAIRRTARARRPRFAPPA